MEHVNSLLVLFYRLLVRKKASFVFSFTLLFSKALGKQFLLSVVCKIIFFREGTPKMV
jgi:hypothetical protein